MLEPTKPKGAHKSNLALAAAVAAAVVIPTYAQDGPAPVAQATQHPMNQSGAMGRIEFSNAPGGGLIVTGTAIGLQPSVGRYVTLVYDRGSVPGGPEACEPTTPIAGMFVGIWSVNAMGKGTLNQVAPPAAIAPLDEIDTISIRDTTINGGFGVQAVVACGEIAVFGGR